MEENYEDELTLLSELALSDFAIMQDKTSGAEAKREATSRFFDTIRLMHDSVRISSDVEQLNFEREKLDKHLELEKEKLENEREIEKEKAKVEKLKTAAKIGVAAGTLAVGGIIAVKSYNVELNSVNTMKETSSLGKGIFNTLFRTTIF